MKNYWDYNYLLLKQYYEEHGNINVPRYYEINGIKLGAWLNYLRRVYKGAVSGIITQEQIDKLNELGIKWDYNSDIWNEKYEMLEKYYQDNGNIDIPRHYKVNGFDLGSWLISQRQMYNGKRKSSLTQEQMDKLNKLGIKWDYNSDIWNEYYKLLEKFYKDNGHINVPHDYQINGVKLGVWVDSQRQAYKGHGTCKINEEQIARLNKLGMIWSLNEDNWNKKYQLLKEYYIKNGNINLPPKYIIKGINLSDWLSSQRIAYHANKLTQEQIDKLNELGIKWNVILDNWNEKYQILKEYYDTNGNSNISSDYQIGDIYLGRWISCQRRAYKGTDSHKISNEQIILLNKLEFDWTPKETRRLNREITNIKIYNSTLLKRMNSVLNDLILEDINEINNAEQQQEIEKIMIKRIWH